jgi:hypothetical protein
MNLKPERGALRVHLRNPADDSRVEVSLGSGDTAFRLTPKDMIPRDKSGRIATWPCPALGTNLCWFTLKRDEDAWYAYVDQQPVLRMPELWSGPLNLQHAPENQPPEAEVDDYTQRLGAFAFEDNFLVPAGSEFPPTWEIMGGIWKLHSVTARSAAHPAAISSRASRSRRRARTSTPGGAAPTPWCWRRAVLQPLRLPGRVQHNSGTNGLVFLAGEFGGSSPLRLGPIPRPTAWSLSCGASRRRPTRRPKRWRPCRPNFRPASGCCSKCR